MCEGVQRDVERKVESSRVLAQDLLFFCWCEVLDDFEVLPNLVRVLPLDDGCHRFTAQIQQPPVISHTGLSNCNIPTHEEITH